MSKRNQVTYPIQIIKHPALVSKTLTDKYLFLPDNNISARITNKNAHLSANANIPSQMMIRPDINYNRKERGSIVNGTGQS